MTAPVAGLFWTPYADWIYTVVSLSGLMLESNKRLGNGSSRCCNLQPIATNK